MIDEKPVFVASDVHFGAAPPAHEQAFLQWLEHAGSDASAIIVNGDLFDFWFEYRRGTTRGHEALLGRLRAIVSGGVPVTLVGGNHDWWGGSYLREEVGVEFLDEPVVRRIAGRRAFLGHGDGLGEGDAGYRATKWVLRSPLARWGFSLLPPTAGDRIAASVSNTRDRWEVWSDHQRERSEALERWARETLQRDAELELVLLGHTHAPMLEEIEPDRWYVNSGDWVRNQSYVVLAAHEPPRLLDWRERTEGCDG